MMRKQCDRPHCKGKKRATHVVVMVRHGESTWNEKNLFTGWFDAELSEKGRQESVRAGKIIKKSGRRFDLAFTSVLSRSVESLNLILKEINQEDIPIYRTWRMNERHYGNLTGLNKAETIQKYGAELVQLWRRSYDTAPPPIERSNKYYDIIMNDARYTFGPAPSEFPMAESLKDTAERLLPYWNGTVSPKILSGRSVLIVSHANSFRGIIKYLEDLSNEEVLELYIPSGLPFYYELDHQMKPVANGRMKYMGDPEDATKAIKFLKQLESMK